MMKAEDNELFGERHEQEENGLYGRKHFEELEKKYNDLIEQLKDISTAAPKYRWDKVEKLIKDELNKEK